MRRRGAILASLSFLATPVARAHGLHAAFTTIAANPASGSLDVVHRLFTRDLDTVVKARTDAAVGADGSAAFEAAFASYLAETFVLTDAGDRALPLRWLRATTGADTVAAFQESPGGAALRRFTVNSQILTSVNPGQANTVTVSVGGVTKTAVFMDGDKPITFAF